MATYSSIDTFPLFRLRVGRGYTLSCPSDDLARLFFNFLRALVCGVLRHCVWLLRLLIRTLLQIRLIRLFRHPGNQYQPSCAFEATPKPIVY